MEKKNPIWITREDFSLDGLDIKDNNDAISFLLHIIIN